MYNGFNSILQDNLNNSTRNVGSSIKSVMLVTPYRDRLIDRRIDYTMCNDSSMTHIIRWFLIVYQTQTTSYIILLSTGVLYTNIPTLIQVFLDIIDVMLFILEHSCIYIHVSQSNMSIIRTRAIVIEHLNHNRVN